MKAKIDENVPSSVVRLFVEHGHAADTAQTEGLAGASDERVAEFARKEDRLLVTLDRGFADIRAYPPGAIQGLWCSGSQTNGHGSLPRLCVRCWRSTTWPNFEVVLSSCSPA